MIVLVIILFTLYYISPKAIKVLTKFLNSSFFASFFGAVAGAVSIFTIDWFRKQRSLLADINTSIGVLTSLLNTLFNIKEQHVLPMVTHYMENVKRYKEAKIKSSENSQKESQPIEILMYMQKFHCPELHFELPLDRVFSKSYKKPQVVPLLMHTKRSVGNVEQMIKIWNELTDHMKDLPESEKSLAYFGEHTAPDMIDTNFPDTVSNVAKSVDDGLFFINQSIRSLTALGKKSLPPWLNEKIIRSEITNEKSKFMLPPDNYLPGWTEGE